MSSAGALVRLSLDQQLQGRRWYYALATFVVVLMIGTLWANDKHDSFGHAAALAFMIAFHCGIASDRAAGFDLFMGNFARPTEVFTYKTATIGALYVVMFVAWFLLASVAWLDVRAAAWYTLYYFLMLSLLVPIALLVETTFNTSLPGLVALMLATFAVGAWIKLMSAMTVAHTLGIDVPVGSFSQLQRLAIVSAIWLLIGLASVRSVVKLRG